MPIGLTIPDFDTKLGPFDVSVIQKKLGDRDSPFWLNALNILSSTGNMFSHRRVAIV